MASPHHRILATIFREHLLGISPRHAGIWMERRELADLLRLLECGLSRLDSRYSHPESLPLHLESVAEFLASVRAQMGALRKPAQRQPAPRARAASATAGAASNWAT
ncbi:MAG: hypothetical protein U5J83_11375 [Bryobacterales bacterium]|nr:hypothetical protein [Bryobacterales bacterium]